MSLDPTARDTTSFWDEPKGLGRTLLQTCAIACVLSFVAITVSIHATGQTWASSAGLGAFIALWGGLGFGSMVGGVIFLTNQEKVEHLDLDHDRQTDRERSSRSAST